MFGGEAALQHKTRKQIYNYISTHPGVSFGNIRNFLGLNESTLKYHLIYLERAREITSKPEGRRRCYFCAHQQSSILRSQPRAAHFDLSGTQQRIVNLIRNRPGITKQDLISQTKLNRKTVSYNIDKLLEQKLIWQIKTENGIGFEYITKEKLRIEMYNQLLLKLLSDEIDEETFNRIKKKLETMDIDNIQV